MITSVNGFVLCFPTTATKKIVQHGAVVASLAKVELVSMKVAAPAEGTKRPYEAGATVFVRGEIYSQELLRSKTGCPGVEGDVLVVPEGHIIAVES
jgi:hypothetical protein